MKSQKDMLRHIMQGTYTIKDTEKLLSKMLENKKIVHDDFKQIVGRYTLKNTNLVWQYEFKEAILEVTNRLRNALSIATIKTVNNILNCHIKERSPECYPWETVKELIVNMDLESGFVTIDGRSEKILKCIKKFLQKYIEITDEQFEKTMICYIYNISRVNKELTLVISDDILSTAGMSSCAPMANGKRVWTSCQSLYDRTTQVLSNLIDRESVIAYVTDETMTSVNGHAEIQYEQMLQRNILRLVEDDNGNKFIIIDRSYPNDKYLFHIILELQKRLKGTGIIVTIPFDYNYAQNDKGGVYFQLKSMLEGVKSTNVYQISEREFYLCEYPYADNYECIIDADECYDDEDEVEYIGGRYEYKVYKSLPPIQDYFDLNGGK